MKNRILFSIALAVVFAAVAATPLMATSINFSQTATSPSVTISATFTATTNASNVITSVTGTADINGVAPQAITGVAVIPAPVTSPAAVAGGHYAVTPGGPPSNQAPYDNVLVAGGNAGGTPDAGGIALMLANGDELLIWQGTIALGSVNWYEWDYGIGTFAGDFNSVHSSPIPEPGSLMLLGSGLVGLAGLIRRKMAARA